MGGEIKAIGYLKTVMTISTSRWRSSTMPADIAGSQGGKPPNQVG